MHERGFLNKWLHYSGHTHLQIVQSRHLIPVCCNAEVLTCNGSFIQNYFQQENFKHQNIHNFMKFLPYNTIRYKFWVAIVIKAYSVGEKTNRLLNNGHAFTFWVICRYFQAKVMHTLLLPIHYFCLDNIHLFLTT